MEGNIKMSKAGIYWTKAGTGDCDFSKTPPYPSFNALAVLVGSFASQYVNRAMVNAFWERYQGATDEITQAYNDALQQNRDLQKKVDQLETELKKWTSQQGKGKRPDQRIYNRTEEVRSWKASGLSNREIARRIGVSEATIRRILNT